MAASVIITFIFQENTTESKTEMLDADLSNSVVGLIITVLKNKPKIVPKVLERKTFTSFEVSLILSYSVTETTGSELSICSDKVGNRRLAHYFSRKPQS